MTTTTTFERFVVRPDAGLPVVYSDGPEFRLQSACEPVVGKFEADGPVVWVLLDVNQANHHVLVDPTDDGDTIDTMTRAIEQLTAARNQLVRLREI